MKKRAKYHSKSHKQTGKKYQWTRSLACPILMRPREANLLLAFPGQASAARKYSHNVSPTKRQYHRKNKARLFFSRKSTTWRLSSANFFTRLRKANKHHILTIGMHNHGHWQHNHGQFIPIVGMQHNRAVGVGRNGKQSA